MIDVNSTTVNTDNKHMTVGESQFIHTTASSENTTEKTVLWSSSDSNIATVNETSGLVMAQNPGTAFVQATAQDGSGIVSTCSITVSNSIPVNSVILNRSYVELHKDETVKLSATI